MDFKVRVQPETMHFFCLFDCYCHTNDYCESARLILDLDPAWSQALLFNSMVVKYVRIRDRIKASSVTDHGLGTMQQTNDTDRNPVHLIVHVHDDADHKNSKIVI